MAGMFNTYLAGFTLVCFVLGLLVSHPKTSVNMNAMFPKLSGENAYSLMALLGTNIIVHSFYTHSSVVQVSSNISSPCLVIIARWHISRYIWCALNWFFFHSFSAYLICLGVVYHVLIEMSYAQVQRRFLVPTLGSPVPWSLFLYSFILFWDFSCELYSAELSGRWIKKRNGHSLSRGSTVNEWGLCLPSLLIRLVLSSLAFLVYIRAESNCQNYKK